MGTEQIILTTLIPAIVFLFGLELKHHKSTKDKLDETTKRLEACQSKCTSLEIRVAVLEVPVANLAEAAQTVASSVKAVATDVVQTLKVLAVDKKP
jgi:hypothetical protein